MDTPSQQNLNQLPPGTILGDFKITGVVGEGGFGIVYLAYEATLDRTVAIKEYLPSSIAGRTGNQSVMVRSQLNTNAFTSGLKNFLREAQMLARFSHPAMVEVHRVWEQNSTAYMAMRYYPGKTLRELRQASSDFDEASIRRILEPIFDALSLLHAQNVIHRDVSPDNILMRGNGAPVLLDLGAARMVIGGMTQALTTVLKPGYAPIEQYVDDGTMQQGPWTDVYGLGAVLYFLLVGAAPPQAVARMITDPLRNMASAVKIPVAPNIVDAVIKALAVRPENRFQSVDELRDGLGWTEPLPAEPRTTYARAENIGVARAGSSAGAPVTKQQTRVAAPANLPPPPPPSAPMPLDRVFAQDSDATVVWKGRPVTASPSPAVAVPAPIPQPVPPAPARSTSMPAAKAAKPVAPAPEALQSAATPRHKEYGESSGSSKWIAAAAAALLAAGAGYWYMGRSGTSAPGAATSSESAEKAPTTSGTPTVATAPPPAVTPSKADSNPGATTSVAANVSPAPPPPVTKTADPAKPLADVKTKEAARGDVDEQAAAKAKREAEEKAKAKLDAQEKAAKVKADAEERAKAKAKQDAEDRAAANAQRTEAEERARKARQEEEDRLAAARARQEAADRQAKASSAPPAAPRSIDELSSQAMAAFKRGELLAARNLWTEIVNHPQSTARSKAVAYNNMAVSYCQNGDEANCERMYVAMLRADRGYSIDAAEREHPHFKRAYERALRFARG